jgi:FkbM family methyltransferase
MDFVNAELGKLDSISRTKAAFLLYRSMYSYYILPRVKARIGSVIPFAGALKKQYNFRRFKKQLAQVPEESALVKEGYVTETELFKLKGSPYHSASELLGKPVSITDSFWYLHSLKELFIDEVYRFPSSRPDPYILDCGANIGLSAIYFKRLYPKARVIAFEPDDHIFKLLQNNLQSFGFNDVQLEKKAIWTEETVLDFSGLGSLGGKLVDEGSKDGVNIISVPTVRLKDYLSQKVDFLKMDIEGPEVKVLCDCAESLGNVENLFVEYHSDPAKPQELHTLLTVLNQAGFRVYIKEAWNNLPFPFMRKQYKPFYDLQLNIFAYRFNNSEA